MCLKRPQLQAELQLWSCWHFQRARQCASLTTMFPWAKMLTQMMRYKPQQSRCEACKGRRDVRSVQASSTGAYGAEATRHRRHVPLQRLQVRPSNLLQPHHQHAITPLRSPAARLAHRPSGHRTHTSLSSGPNSSAPSRPSLLKKPRSRPSASFTAAHTDCTWRQSCTLG
jgi:hypothetical protein